MHPTQSWLYHIAYGVAHIGEHIGRLLRSQGATAQRTLGPRFSWALFTGGMPRLCMVCNGA